MSSASHRNSPHQTNAQYQLGVAAYESGRFAEAISILTRVADRSDLPGQLARYYLGRAHLQYGLGELAQRRFANAAEHLQAAVALQVEGDLSRHLAACFVGQQRFDLAAEAFERQLQRGGGDEATPIRLALSHWKQGQTTRAIDTLSAATRREPGRADLFMQLGLLFASQDDYRLALDALDTAARLAPLDAAIRQHLGLTHAALGAWSAAVEHLSVAQQLRPQDAYVALQLTLAARAANGEGAAAPLAISRPAPTAPDTSAIQQLGQVILKEPDFVEAFLALPRCGIDTEVFGVLAATLEWATERQPELADLHYHCSRVYQRLGRTYEAIDAARRAVEVSPQFVQALIQLGKLYGETDNTQDGIARLEAAIEAGGDYPDVHLMLGQLYQRRGQRGAARQAFERALQLNSGYRAAQTALAELAVA